MCNYKFKLNENIINYYFTGKIKLRMRMKFKFKTLDTKTNTTCFLNFLSVQLTQHTVEFLDMVYLYLHNVVGTVVHFITCFNL